VAILEQQEDNPMIMTRRKAMTLALAAPLVPLAARTAFAEAHATVHLVTIQDMAFSPVNLTINAGDTVQFTNADSMRHSAMDMNGSWDTGLLNTGQSASLTFNGRGTYSYRCGPHANMRGTITIG